jgi:hypothetical protein
VSTVTHNGTLNWLDLLLKQRLWSKLSELPLGDFSWPFDGKQANFYSRKEREQQDAEATLSSAKSALQQLQFSLSTDRQTIKTKKEELISG